GARQGRACRPRERLRAAHRAAGGTPMSTLDSLIRLHRWQVDERRRHLADLDRLRDKLALDVQALDDEERREQEIARNSPEAGYAYAGFARTLVARRQKLAQSIAEV